MTGKNPNDDDQEATDEAADDDNDDIYRRRLLVSPTLATRSRLLAHQFLILIYGSEIKDLIKFYLKIIY